MRTTDSRPELLRILGPATAVAVIVGSVIGSGIFKKPQAVAQNIQTFDLTAAAWILGGVLAILGALAIAELGAMLPRAGGNYVYLKEGYGPLWGFLWGWVDCWILRTGSIAALATMFSESLAGIIQGHYAMNGWEVKGLTAAVILALALVNALGVRWGGLIQNLTTLLKVGSLLAIAVLPFALGRAEFRLLGEPGPAPPSVLVGFGTAVLSVLWAYHGWMNLGPIAEELREPQRNIPRALILGVGIVIFVYLSANLAYALVVPRTEMAATTESSVAVAFAKSVFSGWGSEAMTRAGQAIAAAIMVSAFGALNANILIGPRTFFALGRDGLFPTFLGRVHPRFRTPALAILIQAAWAVALVLGSELIRESEKESPFDTITNFVMFGAIIFETMAVAAVFRLRKLRPEWPRPYRCWGYPWVPVVYVIVMALVLANTVYDQRKKSLIGFVFIGLGAAVYFLFARGRAVESVAAPPQGR